MVTGLVLAGGRGERLGGVDKGLISERGIPAAVRVAAALRETCATVLVSANRNLDTYAAMDFDAVVPDSLPDFAGPLAALLAAGEYGVTGTLVIAPCDMPTLSPEVPRSLIERLEADPQLDLVYADTGDVPQYLVAAMRTTCLEGWMCSSHPGDGLYADGMSRSRPPPATSATCRLWVLRIAMVPTNGADTAPGLHAKGLSALPTATA